MGLRVNMLTLPCNEIWYCMAENRVYQGWVMNIVEGGIADMLCIGQEFGDFLPINDCPYGKDKKGHWYFKNISEATKNIMANVGRPLVGDEEYPAYFVKQKEVALEEEFVEKVVKDKLTELKESPNGADSTIKHRKAAANI